MTFDTNILIAYVANEEPVVSALQQFKRDGAPFILPAMVEAEFLSYSKWDKAQRIAIEKFLENHFLFVPLDRPIARIIASIRQQTRLKAADASIAATAIFTNTPLATRNVRDFKNVAGLELFSF